MTGNEFGSHNEKVPRAIAVAGIVIAVGCGRAEKPAVQAPDHFVPLPNHPPAALASPTATIPANNAGEANRRSKSHRELAGSERMTPPAPEDRS